VIAYDGGAVSEVIEKAGRASSFKEVEGAYGGRSRVPELSRVRCREVFEKRFTPSHGEQLPAGVRARNPLLPEHALRNRRNGEEVISLSEDFYPLNLPSAWTTVSTVLNTGTRSQSSTDSATSREIRPRPAWCLPSRHSVPLPFALWWERIGLCC